MLLALIILLSLLLPAHHDAVTVQPPSVRTVIVYEYIEQQELPLIKSQILNVHSTVKVPDPVKLIHLPKRKVVHHKHNLVVKSSAKVPFTHSRILAVARQWLSIPYLWGGSSRSGIDCSGFTMVVYKIALNLSLPHYSGSQPNYGHRVFSPLPGDLVHWDGHVGIYYGNGKIIGARHAGTISQIYAIYGSPTFYRMG